MLGFAVHLIGRINKTCQALPGAAAIPTEQSVPTAREVIVISWRREEKDGPAVFSLITRVRKRLRRKVSRRMQRKVVICCFVLTPDQMTQTDQTKSHFNT